MTTPKERILSLITRANGCTHEGFLTADTGYQEATVVRCVEALLTEGRVERGWDERALCLTPEEVLNQRIDARVQSRK